jgi:hypothetical protein
MLTRAIAFGESFNCLNSGSFHIWVAIFFSLARSMSYHQMSSRMPWFMKGIFERYFIPKIVKENVNTLRALNQVSFLSTRS